MGIIEQGLAKYDTLAYQQHCKWEHKRTQRNTKNNNIVIGPKAVPGRHANMLEYMTNGKPTEDQPKIY